MGNQPQGGPPPGSGATVSGTTLDALDDPAGSYMSLNGSAPSVALGMLIMDAAHTMGLAMQNAVALQQNASTVQLTVTSRAVDQLLRNDASDRAMDLLLRLFEAPPQNSAAG